jgi:ribulose-5-phosphate 4-epimerase/fuculose-1-phosphate aldolase
MAGTADQLIISEEPELTNPDEIRQYRKQHLAIAFRAFAHLGYNTGPGGHAAVRDPEHPDWFWTNPFGRPFELIKTSDLMLVDAAGGMVTGKGIVNRAAFAIHSGVHAARPDVMASVHLHGVPGMALSTLGTKLRPLTQDACAYYADHEIYDNFDGPALEITDGERMAKTLGRGKALILQSHGLLTVGTSIDEAAFWMIRLQICCEVQLQAEATGRDLVEIPDDLARLTATVNGTHRAGWFGFQTALQRVVAKEPDVLD